MKEVTIKIPDSKLSFFLELMQQLGLEATPTYTLSEEQLAIVKDRMAQDDHDPNRILDWENGRKNLFVN